MMQEPLPYTIVRSKRRSMALEVTRNRQIIVRVPFFVTDGQARDFVLSKQDWLKKHMQKPLAFRQEYTEEEITDFRQQALKQLPERVAFYAEKMGVQPTGIGVTRARTRYGSCSVKKRLNFSCFLLASPLAAVDYVVVHELCHLIYMNHGRGFYDLLSRVLPDWRERKRALVPIP